MAEEGRLTLVQAEKVYLDMDIRDPSPQVMRSALKEIGKAFEDKKEEAKVKEEIVNILRAEAQDLHFRVENLDDRLRTSELMRRMLVRTVEQDLAKDAKKKKLVNKLQVYLQKLESDG